MAPVTRTSGQRPDGKSRAAPRYPAQSLTSPAAKRPEVMSSVHRASDPAAELAAWGAAVVHFHRLGLPAAVPAFAASWLRRRGVHADWVTRP